MRAMIAVWTAGAVLCLATMPVIAQGTSGSTPADAYKALMDTTADLQDELKDAVSAKDVSKAGASAKEIEKIMARVERYWAQKRANDVVKLAKDSRALAKQVVKTAKARRWDQAEKALGELSASCNTCHDLHAEKR